jgi:hypothetical protein
MLAEYTLMIETQIKDEVKARQAANLLALYRSCLNRKHPVAQEMARRYEQELREIVGASGGGNENRSRSVVLNESCAY